MKKLACIILAALIFAATIPTSADASSRWRSFVKDGYAYVLGSNYGPKAAALVKAPNKKNVTIPRTVTYKGRTYKVRAVWDGAIQRKTRRIDIRTPWLDAIEDDSIFDDARIRVTVHDRATYVWLRTWLRARVVLR